MNDISEYQGQQQQGSLIHLSYLLPVLQCFPEVRGTEVKSGPPALVAAGGCTGDCQPLQPDVT